MTLIGERPLFGGSERTTAPAVAPVSVAKNFVVGTMLAGSVFTTTLSAVTPVDPWALTASATTGRTLPAAPTPSVPEVVRPAAEILNRVRRVSGLSWGDVAAAVGVSRRAVHLWLNGGRVASAHMMRLLGLERLVAAYEVGNAGFTRDQLFRPGPAGRTPLDDFRLDHQAARPSRRPVSGSVADLLAADEDTSATPDLRVARRSTLRGGVIPPRGS